MGGAWGGLCSRMRLLSCVFQQHQLGVRGVRGPVNPVAGCTEEWWGQVTTWLKGRGRRGQGAAVGDQTAKAGSWGLLTTAGGCDLTTLRAHSAFLEASKMLMGSQLLSPPENLLEGNTGRDVCIIQRFPLKC